MYILVSVNGFPFALSVLRASYKAIRLDPNFLKSGSADFSGGRERVSRV